MVKLSKDIRLVNAELGQEEAEEGPEVWLTPGMTSAQKVFGQPQRLCRGCCLVAEGDLGFHRTPAFLRLVQPESLLS